MNIQNYPLTARSADPPVSATLQPAEDALASDLKRHWSLDTMIMWLEIVKAGSDIAPVPYLGGCIGVTLAITKTWQLAQNNLEDCVTLLRKLHQLMDVVLEGHKENCPILSRDSSQEVLLMTYKALQTIEIFVNKLAKKRHKFKRFFLAGADKTTLAKHNAKLDEILSLFHAKVSVKVLNDIGRREQLRMNYRELFESDVHLGPKYKSLDKDWTIYRGFVQNGNSPALVLMQTKKGDPKAEYNEFLRVVHKLRESWEPNLPQFYGASGVTSGKRFIALRGPRVDTDPAMYFAQAARKGQMEEAKMFISMLKGLVFGVGYCFETTGGEWNPANSDVYIDEQGQIVVCNFSSLLEQGASRSGTEHGPENWRHWNSFIRLSDKVLGTDAGKKYDFRGPLNLAPDYLAGKRLEFDFGFGYAHYIAGHLSHPSLNIVPELLMAFGESLTRIEENLERKMFSKETAGRPAIMYSHSPDIAWLHVGLVMLQDRGKLSI